MLILPDARLKILFSLVHHLDERDGDLSPCKRVLKTKMASFGSEDFKTCF